MALTTAQLQALKADITANSDLNVNGNNEDGNTAIAVLYNLAASPTFTVWKTNVTIKEIGAAFDAAELGNRSTADNSRLQVLATYLAGGVNPSLAGPRAFFSDIFSGAGGVTTVGNLAALWRRSATRAEKLFATGVGSVASPATLVVEGKLTAVDVLNARNVS